MISASSLIIHHSIRQSTCGPFNLLSSRFTTEWPCLWATSAEQGHASWERKYGPGNRRSTPNSSNSFLDGCGRLLERRLILLIWPFYCNLVSQQSRLPTDTIISTAVREQCWGTAHPDTDAMNPYCALWQLSLTPYKAGDLPILGRRPADQLT